MHRVFIPTNDWSRPDYWLHHPRSVADLSAMGSALIEGATVRLCSARGDAFDARLHFQAELICWIAYPIRGWRAPPKGEGIDKQ